MGLVGLVIGKPPGQRLPVSAGGIVAKTYAEFQAHIATLATGGVKPWSGVGAQPLGAPGSFRTTAAAAAGDMFGSSWLSQLSDQTWSPCRTIQHGLASEAVFNDQIAAARDIFFRLVAGTNGTLVALNRNGYLSLGDAGAGNTRVICDDLIYWDGTQAQRMNPSTGTGPTPYSF